MALLRLKIDILRSIMNKKLEQNHGVVNGEILSISRMLDNLILEYERQKKKFYGV